VGVKKDLATVRSHLAVALACTKETEKAKLRTAVGNADKAIDKALENYKTGFNAKVTKKLDKVIGPEMKKVAAEFAKGPAGVDAAYRCLVAATKVIDDTIKMVKG